MKAGLSVFACQRCGTALELPDDPRLLHIDCRFCGTDNILPPGLIRARQQQYQLEMAAAAERRVLAEQAAARAATARAARRALLVGLGVALTVIAAVVGLIAWFLHDTSSHRAMAGDPARNGQQRILAHLEVLRREKRCDRILVQPIVHTTHPKTDGVVSLNMVEGDHCVHVLGASGSGAPLTLRYTTGEISLRYPLPPSGSLLDYRLCATKTATHSFRFESSDGSPFTAAAIECPRTVEEGAPRSKEDDPATNGVRQTKAALDALYKAGCNYVVTQPQVLRGKHTLVFNMKQNGPCLSVLVASAFPDVKFRGTYTDPDDNLLPMPEPGSSVRVMTCPRKEGKYTLELQPSTFDHFAQAAIDCPRNGPEGLKREAELRKPR